MWNSNHTVIIPASPLHVLILKFIYNTYYNICSLYIVQNIKVYFKLVLPLYSITTAPAIRNNIMLYIHFYVKYYVFIQTT